MKAYDIKLRLDDFRPLTWRDMIIPSGITFKQLHDIIQIVMDFSDYHLYSFSFKNRRQFILDFNRNIIMEDMDIDSNITVIDEYFDKEKKIYYTYDFGDSWDFTIEIKKTIDSDKPYPILKRYKGDYNPVEDCGGVYSLSELLYYKENPDEDLPDYLEYQMEYLNKIDPDYVQYALKDLFEDNDPI